MADNKWHLVSTFDTTQTLEDFCRSIKFKIDTNEKYIYRIKDGIEANEQVKKDNWYRNTINDDRDNVGKVATYNNGSWQDSTMSKEIIRNNTAYWMYGEKDDTLSIEVPEAKIYTQADYDAVVAERDEMIQNMIDIRVGSSLAKIKNGQAEIKIIVEESNDFTTWHERNPPHTIAFPADVGTGTTFYRIKIEDYEPENRSMSLSSDGTRMAIGSTMSGGVKVYQYNEETNWTQLGNDIKGEVEGYLSGYSVSLSSDGTTVAIQTDDGVKVYQYNEETNWTQREGG